MSETIVFFGSGPVAAKSLQLLAQDFDIEAIITKPSTVKEMSAAANAPTHTVSNKGELDKLMSGKPFKSRLGVLIDFGIIVSRQVIDYFPLGIVNSHFSLLPKLRGADPISFAVLNGDEETGVSLMLLVEAMDEGPLLSQVRYPLPADTTTPQLTDKLIELSYEALRNFLPSYITGELEPYPQPNPESATYSRKLTKEDGVIDWSKSAEQIEREIRAYIDWPRSRTQLAGKEVIVTKARALEESGEPGRLDIRRKELVVFCGDKALVIDELKPAGKANMDAAAFINGYLR